MSRRGEQRKRQQTKVPFNEDEALDQQGRDPAQVGSESGGQSGDSQGLAELPEADSESLQELASEEQAFEAGVVEGVEDAGDHPERPVRVREDRRPAHESELPPDPDWK